MIENSLVSQKSGRYFLSQEPSKEIEQLWIVCHGYGQLANYFLKWFEPISNEKILIVAPEGFHRFYINGFSGRVGASWMTKEDRLNDISDYINFLDDVFLTIVPKLNSNCFIHALGFSQGVATITRWVCNSKIKVDSLTLWAGRIPEEIKIDCNIEKLNALNLKLFYGTDDPFYSEVSVEKELDIIKNQKINFLPNKYEGKHKIEIDPLKKLYSQIEFERIKLLNK